MFHYHLDLIKRYPIKNYEDNYKFFTSNKTKLKEIGETSSDELINNLNKEKILKKYKLNNQNILLYLPFPFNPERAFRSGNYAWEAAFSGLFSNIYLQKKELD